MRRPWWPAACPPAGAALVGALGGPVPADPGLLDGLKLLAGVWAAVVCLVPASRWLGEPLPVAAGRALFFACVGPVATGLVTATVLIPPALLWSDAGLPASGLQSLVTVVWHGFAGIAGARIVLGVRRQMDRRYPLRPSP